MFCEDLEKRRLLTVTLRPEIPPSESGNPGTLPPHCAVVTQDSSGKVTIGVNSAFVVKAPLQDKSAEFLAKWVKDSHGNWDVNEVHGNSIRGGHHGEVCALGVAIIETNGTLVVTEIETGATWDVTGATAVVINGSSFSDDVFYTGNSLGAKVTTGGSMDSITIADTGTGSSDADAGDGDDTLNLLVGNGTGAGTTLRAGNGADLININTGVGIYDTANAEAIVFADGGNDTITVYDGTNTINGGNGNDVVLQLGGNNTVTSATVQS